MYCKGFSRRIGHYFTENTIHVSALTGAAATEIGGDTTAREFSLRSKKESATMEDLGRFQDTRLCIVDEVSFADYDNDLGKLSMNLQNFTENREWQYGNTSVVFLGDFCQLEPVGENSIYKHPNGLYWEQSLTNMVELKGTHRYRDCEHLQRIMPELRDTGLLEQEDRDLINSRLVDNEKVYLPRMEDVRFATFYNKTRCKINSAVFLNYLRKHHSTATKDNIPNTAIVIKAEARWGQTKTPLSWDHRKVLFEECAESDITDDNSKRCDPFLCLFSGCHVMGTENTNVKTGIANGTTATFVKAVIKPGKAPSPCKVSGFWVLAISIEDIECLVLQWHDCRFKGTFKVWPQTKKWKVSFPIEEFGEKLRMKASMELTQFNININHATTGHKLQGKSLDQLVIAEWSKRKNWAYVVLSRVRKLTGLYLMHPLPNDIDFTPNQQYLEMMDRLRHTIAASASDVIQFHNMLRNGV